jgi:hypothetical protein
MSSADVVALYDALYPVLGTFYIGLIAIRMVWRLS